MSLQPLAAAVTLGQAPREDIVDEIRAEVPEFRWIQLGALDEVNFDGVERLRPGSNEFPLATRMRGGTPVLVGEDSLRPFVQRAVNRAASEVDLIVVLSSSPLAVESPVPVLFPDRLLTAAVAAFGCDARIVVLTPSAEQIPLQRARWRSLGFIPEVVYASPYGGTDFRLVGEAIGRMRPSVVVLDCIAYTSEMRAAVASASHVPTLLVRSLVASLAHQAVCLPLPEPCLPVSGGRRSVALEGVRARSTHTTLTVLGAGRQMYAAGAAAGRRHAPAAGAARLASDLRLAYFLGAVQPGDRLPSVRELALRLRVSPTTVADWYRALLDRGLVASRMRSGMFVKAPGPAPPLGRGEAGMLGVLQRALHQLEMVGRSAREVAEFLKPCVEEGLEHVTFGCAMHREMYDVLVPHLDRRLGFHLPARLLACHEDQYEALRRQVASDRGIACLLSTFLESDFADRLAEDLGLGVVELQLHPNTVEALSPPQHGRRHIFTRDSGFAAAIRSLSALIGGADDSGEPRLFVTSLSEPGPIPNEIREADELLVSSAALELARQRLAAPHGPRLLQFRLADQTIDEILFRFLLLARTNLQPGA